MSNDNHLPGSVIKGSYFIDLTRKINLVLVTESSAHSEAEIMGGCQGVPISFSHGDETGLINISPS